VFVPKKFLTALENEPNHFVVTRGLDHCLFLFTASAWAEVLAKLRVKSVGDPVVREFQRRFLGAAEQVDIDAQGRIRLPEGLAARAGLTKDVVFAGLDSRLELWDAERWDAEEASGSDDEFNDHAAQVLS
jgi:MraZ protein